jgi:hypothetical protein
MNLIEFVELEEKRDIRPDTVCRKDILWYQNIFPRYKQTFDRSFDGGDVGCHTFGYPVDFLQPKIDVGDIFGIREIFQHYVFMFIWIIDAERKSIQAYLNG